MTEFLIGKTFICKGIVLKEGIKAWVKPWEDTHFLKKGKNRAVPFHPDTGTQQFIEVINGDKTSQ